MSDLEDAAKGPEPDQSTSKQIQFKLVMPSQDRVPYQKVDLSRACFYGDDFAINFYQLNYLSLADHVQSKSSEPPTVYPSNVVKVVMNRDIFVQLVRELMNLARKAGIDAGDLDPEKADGDGLST